MRNERRSEAMWRRKQENLQRGGGGLEPQETRREIQQDERQRHSGSEKKQRYGKVAELQKRTEREMKQESQQKGAKGRTKKLRCRFSKSSEATGELEAGGSAGEEKTRRRRSRTSQLQATKYTKYTQTRSKQQEVSKQADQETKEPGSFHEKKQ